MQVTEKKTQIGSYQRTCYHFRAGEEVEGENGKEELSEHSLRMGNLRGKAKNQSFESESSQRDSRKKKLVQEHARKRKTEGENAVNPEEEREGNRRITL